MGAGAGRDRSSVGPVFAGFVVLVVLAGGNAVAIRVVNRELEPLWGATLRFSLAAASFGVIVLGFGLPMPAPRARLGAALYGVLFFGIGFGLVHWSLIDVGAGLAQTLLAATPLFTVALAWAQRLESLRWSVVAGSGFALGGVALIFSRALPDAVPKLSALAVLAAAACWAQAGIVVKRFPPTHPAWMNMIAMTVGTFGVFSAAVLRGESLSAPREAATRMAIAYLVVPGTLAVFGLYVFVLRHWDASVASFQLVLIPLVAVPVSAWIDDEPITLVFLAGASLVLTGAYLALRRPTETLTRIADTI